MLGYRWIQIASFIMATVLGPALCNAAHAADPAPLYHWSNYERDLFLTNDKPDAAERLQAFEATLLRIIQKSEEERSKPPPGLLAEYGYLLYKRGNLISAIDYFRREATQWPEAKVLMERMIERARAGAGS